MKICVHSNRGPRGDEIPCAFYVLERWTDSTHGYFEVMVDDGRRFVLRYQPTLRCWELAACFAAKQPRKPAPKAVTPAAPRKFFSLLHSK